MAHVTNEDADGNELIPGFTPSWQKISTIKVVMGNVHGALKYYDGGVPHSVNSQPLEQAIKSWEQDPDFGAKTAKPFDMVTDTEAAYMGLASTQKFSWPVLTVDSRVKYWSMFLVMIVACARASCVSTYVPTMENIVLPEAHLWDADGLPAWIELGWLDWKSRNGGNRNKRFGIMLHRNYLDSRFCPVFWLMSWLWRSGITTGPIWGDDETNKPKTVEKAMKFIVSFMTVAGLTCHSIRKTGAQWIGRCHGDSSDCMLAGRWNTPQMVARYIGDGHKRAHDFGEVGSEHQDPIYHTWFWKKTSRGGGSGNSHDLL